MISINLELETFSMATCFSCLFPAREKEIHGTLTKCKRNIATPYIWNEKYYLNAREKEIHGSLTKCKRNIAIPYIWNEKYYLKTTIERAHPGSNRRPIDLQSIALPLSYGPISCLVRQRLLLNWHHPEFQPKQTKFSQALQREQEAIVLHQHSCGREFCSQYMLREKNGCWIVSCDRMKRNTRTSFEDNTISTFDNTISTFTMFFAATRIECLICNSSTSCWQIQDMDTNPPA